MTAVLNILLGLVGLYLLCGLVFSVPFVLKGAGAVDPAAKGGTWGFRLIIIPGLLVFWPLLARRWLSGVQHPPEECNEHRVRARRSAGRTEGP